MDEYITLRRAEFDAMDDYRTAYLFLTGWISSVASDIGDKSLADRLTDGIDAADALCGR